ncbi:MAG: Dabb family protein [Nitrospinota bacterium]|nr:Dabb family protein [Nitrospinota bacterium]
MIKHVVMFKLAQKTPENMKRAMQSLKSLEGNIETLKTIEIGSDFLESERSYDIVLITQFDNPEGLKIYAQHENHLPVVKIMQSLCTSSVVVDYKI